MNSLGRQATEALKKLRNEIELIQGEITGSPCPHCDKVLDGFTGIGGIKPEPGNSTICGYCWQVCIFTKTGLRKATLGELKELAAELQFQLLMGIVQKLKRGTDD